MHWANHESGFKNFLPCEKYITQSIIQANKKIKLIDSNKTIIMCNIDACDPYAYQNQNNKILITNNWVSPSFLNSKYYEQFAPSLYGMYAGDVSIENIVPTQNFNCFINRIDPIRQSWLYQLIRRDIFNQGYVSFNMDISRHIQFKQYDATATSADVFEDQFHQKLSIFELEHNSIKDQVPYCNFDPSAELNRIIMQTKFSIVLETYADRNEIITFSEKIFRCLKLPRPWIMFAMKDAVKYLRNLGFDVLDDIVDHSYDSIEFDIDRQVKMLDIAQELCKIEFTNTIINRMKTAAEHNQQLLSKFYSTFNNDISQSIDNAKTKCLCLNGTN
jgi:hypothetical protein